MGQNLNTYYIITEWRLELNEDRMIEERYNPVLIDIYTAKICVEKERMI